MLAPTALPTLSEQLQFELVLFTAACLLESDVPGHNISKAM